MTHFELVSPILVGEDGLEELGKSLLGFGACNVKIMEAVDWQVPDEC